MHRPFLLLLCDVRDGLRSRPGRTAFSIFAVTAGMTALTMLTAVLGGLRERARAVEQEFGANVLAIDAGADPQGGFSDHHVEVLRANLPGALVSAARRQAAPLRGYGNAEVIGADHLLMEIRGWRLAQGRWLDHLDIRDAQRHAVIAEALSRRLGLERGDRIALGRTVFLIVGVLAGGDTEPGRPVANRILMNAGHSVYVPCSVLPVWITGSAVRPSGYDTLFVRSMTGEAPEPLEMKAQRLLDHPALRRKSMSFVTPVTLLEGIRRLQRVVRWTAGSVTVLCLLLGGMTLMSLMAANVRERLPEIGLRLTLGATPRDIGALFVCEACLLMGISAALGEALGLAALVSVGAQLPVPIAIGRDAFLIPAAVALGLGALFSYLPARSAAAIRPSEALRNP